MRHFRLLTGVLALLLMAVALAAPAQAQATRTWVSGVGDDANPCSRTAPCKTFAGSISKTAASGEIDCLDSGGFGALTITKAITIDCEGVVGGVLVSGANGITIAAGTSDHVVLKGLDFEGVGSGLDGVSFTSGAALEIDHMSIRDFTGNGIKVANSGPSFLFISDTQILDNGTAGIALVAGAAANVFANIDNVRLDHNATGLSVSDGGSTANSRVTFRNSAAAGNTGDGVLATGGKGEIRLVVDGSSVVNNGVGLLSSGATAEILVTNTDINGNQTGLKSTLEGHVVSYGNNRLTANLTTNGVFTGSASQQ